MLSIHAKTSKSPGKSREVQGWTSIRKQGKLNTFKNTPEDDPDTFCDLISHLTPTNTAFSVLFRQLAHRGKSYSILPIDVIESKDVNQFKNRLDSYILKERSTVEEALRLGKISLDVD